MMQEWNEKNKKRREQQVRLIKQGIPPAIPQPPQTWPKERDSANERSTELAPWNQMSFLDPAKKKRERRFFWQLISSVFLFVITFLIFQAKSPAIHPAEQFMSEVITRDFNFTGLSDWYKQYVGNAPAVLPAFFDDPQETTDKTNLGYMAPVKGKIVWPFDEKRKGIVIRTAEKAEVVAATDGWVTFAGHKEGLGNTIIIQHTNGRETWYGWLQKMNVNEKDWVKRGQRIGDVAQTKGQSLVYFALKKDEQFINPTGVISFE